MRTKKINTVETAAAHVPTVTEMLKAEVAAHEAKARDDARLAREAAERAEAERAEKERAEAEREEAERKAEAEKAELAAKNKAAYIARMERTYTILSALNICFNNALNAHRKEFISCQIFDWPEFQNFKSNLDSVLWDVKQKLLNA